MSDLQLRARRASLLLVHVLLLAPPLVPGCVLHTAGLTVDVGLSLRPSMAVRSPRITDLALLDCPGTGPGPHHTHEEPIWDLPIGGEETVSLTSRPGRYCDLRVQLEAEGTAPRQAVVPLLCGGARAELVLDEASLRTAPPRIELRAAVVEPALPAGDPLAAQLAVDALLRSLTATLACARP
jgi:hypothetical protein